MKTPSTDQMIELLRNNIIFRDADQTGKRGGDVLEEAVEIMSISEHKAGDIIFEQGDKGDSIVLLLKGEVGVYVLDGSGDEHHIATIEENHFFGEMAIIDDSDRMATVRAISDCLLGTIFSDDFWAYFHKHPILATNVLRGINQRLRETDASYIERLAKEREALVRFNRELERKVNEKTEQLRQRDLQLMEMDRIASIGTLAAGIAHEINNPLGFVKSSTGILKKSLDKMIGAAKYWDDKDIPAPLLEGYNDYLDRINYDDLTKSLDKRYDRITRGIERITKIVNSLKSFSRVDMEAIGQLDFNRSMEDAIDVLSTQDDKEVVFIKAFEDLPLLECYPSEINQCLLHVLNNALDAIDHKGTIELMTAFCEEEDQIVIRIADDGKGMSPEVAKQAFNPFFTTKAVGSGTGVGLSITERIIRRHGGRIDISTKEGEGTTVTISLPTAGEVGRETA